MNTCPICGNELKDDMKLIAYYYPARNWWVVAHLTKVIGGITNLNGEAYTDYRLYCHEVGFKLEKLPC